jgi:hypothetical protein
VVTTVKNVVGEFLRKLVGGITESPGISGLITRGITEGISYWGIFFNSSQTHILLGDDAVLLISFIFTKFQPHRMKTKKSGDDGQKKKIEGSFGDQGLKKKKNVFFYRNHILTPQGMEKKNVFYGTRTRGPRARNPYKAGLRPIFFTRVISSVVRADDT